MSLTKGTVYSIIAIFLYFPNLLNILSVLYKPSYFNYFSLMYFPDLILLSAGFTASFGMAHVLPNFIAPSIIPSLQIVYTLLTERFHFSTASLIVINSIFSYLNKSYKIRHFTLHSIISAETPKTNLNLPQICTFLPIYTFVHITKKYTLWLTFILLRHKVYLFLHPS